MHTETTKSIENKNVLICITASLAAVKSVELVRELKRRGAKVKVIINPEAERIIGIDALKFVCKIGEESHVELVGINGWADIVLIAPATANTISKIAQGIADSKVTLIALTAIGSGKKVIIAPAMHYGMYNNPIFQENLKKFSLIENVEIIKPEISENKAKLPSIDVICLYVERAIYPKQFSGKKVVVTSGPTLEYIDPIRFISNKSSGKMGRELALEFWRRGACVTHITSKPTGLKLPNFREIKVVSVMDMLKSCLREVKDNCYLFVSAAAPSDFLVEKCNSKIKTCNEFTLKLKAAPKIIHEVRKIYSGHIIGFKAETGVKDCELLDLAIEKMINDGLEMVVANDVAEKGMGTIDTKVIVVTKKSRNWFEGNKKEIARNIIDVYVREFFK